MTISTDKLIEALENFSMEFETFDYNQSDWVERDELSFARKILIQGLMDKVYFLTAGNKAKGKDGSDVFAAKKKQQYKDAARAYKGGELDINELRQAQANAKAASAKNDVLGDLMNNLQNLYVSENYDEYIPWNAPKTGNVAAEEQDLPDDIAAELAAMDGKAANTSKKKKVA